MSICVLCNRKRQLPEAEDLDTSVTDHSLPNHNNYDAEKRNSVLETLFHTILRIPKGNLKNLLSNCGETPPTCEKCFQLAVNLDQFLNDLTSLQAQVCKKVNWLTKRVESLKNDVLQSEDGNNSNESKQRRKRSCRINDAIVKLRQEVLLTLHGINKI